MIVRLWFILALLTFAICPILLFATPHIDFYGGRAEGKVLNTPYNAQQLFYLIAHEKESKNCSPKLDMTIGNDGLIYIEYKIIYDDPISEKGVNIGEVYSVTHWHGGKAALVFAFWIVATAMLIALLTGSLGDIFSIR